jgi:hypothetical protein
MKPNHWLAQILVLWVSRIELLNSRGIDYVMAGPMGARAATASNVLDNGKQIG